MYSERYGYQARTVNGKQFLVTVEPHPEFSDKELSELQWKRVSEAK
jgi:hypothetical protein